MALHASHDRLANATPVSRHRAGVEARAAIAHEDLRPLVRSLGVDVDAPGAGELRGVEDRLARGGGQRGGVAVERPVADADDLDLDAVLLLDVRGRAHQRTVQRVRRRGLVGVQPGAKLAFLAARELGHLGGVVGAALDHRQRLQHRVVQVRRHLGALLGADARRALGRERLRHAQPPRPEEEHAPRQYDDHRGGERLQAPDRRQRRGDRDGAADHERPADPALARAQDAAAPQHHHGRRAGSDGQRDSSVAAERHDDGRRDHAGSHAFAPARADLAQGGHRIGDRRIGRHRPHGDEGQAVQRDADAAGDREDHERDADDADADAEVARDPHAHAGEDPVLAPEPRDAAGGGGHLDRH